MAKSRGIAEQWYDLALYEYGSAMGLEEAMGDQEKIDGHWGLSAKYSWFSLVLGNPNAPYALYKCFGQGLGVKKDEYIASLMFGVAKKLDDPECQQGIKCKDIRDSMVVQINNLYDLFKRAQSEVSADGVEMSKIYCQMMLFDEHTKFLGKSIFGLSNHTEKELGSREEKEPYLHSNTGKEEKEPYFGKGASEHCCIVM